MWHSSTLPAACFHVPLEIQAAAGRLSYRSCAQKQDPSVCNVVPPATYIWGCLIPVSCSTKSSWSYPRVRFGLPAALLSEADLTSGVTGPGCISVIYLLKLISSDCNDLFRPRASCNRELLFAMPPCLCQLQTSYRFCNSHFPKGHQAAF